MRCRQRKARADKRGLYDNPRERGAVGLKRVRIGACFAYANNHAGLDRAKHHALLRCSVNKRQVRQKQGEYAVVLDPARAIAHIGTMLIETETTPNPATLKFLPGRPVMESGTRDFATPEEAESSPLAEALFSLGDVTGVFFGSSFVSVTAGPGTNWFDLKPEVLSILLDHFSADMPLFKPATAGGFSVPADDAHSDDPADEDIIIQIKELIETRVRPAVANDGGDIIYRGFDKGTVYLKMQGACAGCPSSTATLKNGIESLLKHYVPEVTDVRAV